jgi:hypothetical protein
MDLGGWGAMGPARQKSMSYNFATALRLEPFPLPLFVLSLLRVVSW